MSEIDWSKAPEGATHRSATAWFKRDEVGVYLFDAGMWCLLPWGKSQLDWFWERPSPAWSGEWLPPVGVKCEFEPHNDVWGFSTLEVSECTVIAYHNGFVWLDLGEPGIPVATRVDKIDFRPIRTPEQIAADEREVAVNGMLMAANPAGHRAGYTRQLMECLYEAGYRKQAYK